MEERDPLFDDGRLRVVERRIAETSWGEVAEVPSFEVRVEAPSAGRRRYTLRSKTRSCARTARPADSETARSAGVS
jgi:hypothetical protein